MVPSVIHSYNMFYHISLDHEIMLHPRYFGPQLMDTVKQKLFTEVEGTCTGNIKVRIILRSLPCLNKKMLWVTLRFSWLFRLFIFFKEWNCSLKGDFSISLVPCICIWKKLRQKWTEIHNSINILPNIKSDVSFFFLHNVDCGTAKKNAKFYSFGTFLGPKRLKNDEKWLNFAFHFSDDPEWWPCCDFSY